MNTNYIDIISRILSILIIIITHELAHAYIAYLNGDDTAKNRGRLSLNPFKHLDPVGTLSMLVFRFGWAKAVPINPNNFRNRRFGLFTVSIAGIVINLITAFLAMFILVKFNISFHFIHIFLNDLVIYGVVMAVFNLLPIPPLDGSKILASILPYSFENFIQTYERQSFMILILIIGTRMVNNILNPIIYFIINTFNNILT